MTGVLRQATENYKIRFDKHYVQRTVPHWPAENQEQLNKSVSIYEFIIWVGGLECVRHYFAHFAFLIDVWIRTQRAAVACRRATNLATHLPMY